MKNFVKISLVTALAVSSYASSSLENRVIKLEKELAKTKAEMLKVKKKVNAKFIPTIHCSYSNSKKQ